PGQALSQKTRQGWGTHGLALDKSGGHCGRRLVPRCIPNQNRNCGPKVTRMLLWTPLLKKMLSPISARTPMGPAKASTPPPGYTEKYVAPLAKPTAVWNPVGAPWLVTVKFSNPTLPVTNTRNGPEPVWNFGPNNPCNVRSLLCTVAVVTPLLNVLV